MLIIPTHAAPIQSPNAFIPFHRISITKALTGESTILHCKTNYSGEIATEVLMSYFLENTQPTAIREFDEETESVNFITLVQGGRILDPKETLDPSNGSLSYCLGQDAEALKSLYIKSQRTGVSLLHCESPAALKKDEVFVRLAVQLNPNAVYFADSELLTNRSFIESLSESLRPDQVRSLLARTGQ